MLVSSNAIFATGSITASALFIPRKDVTYDVFSYLHAMLKVEYIPDKSD